MRVAIIGGGASGLFAAIQAKQSSRSDGKELDVTIFESSERVGKKLLVTGNGRCNFSNNDVTVSHYIGDSVFIGRILSNPMASVKDAFESLGILSACEDGRLYPKSKTASSVLDALRFAAENEGCTVVTGKLIDSIKNTGNEWTVDGKHFDAVILCCGGKASVSPDISGYGYTLAESFGHTVTKLRPALTAFKCSDSFFRSLKGIRADGVLSLHCGGCCISKREGEIQFTDYGISGIPAFGLSLYADFSYSKAYELNCDFCPEKSIDSLTEYIRNISSSLSKPTAADAISGIVPKRLAEVIIKSIGLSPAAGLSEYLPRAGDIAKKLKCFSANPVRLNGFDKAQITVGGVATDEVNPDTMESKLIKGLYICGELLDVAGDCGGYNLHFAFATGRIAGSSVLRSW